jgi:hypothetical protein
MWILIALAAILPHIGALGNDFVFDDRGVIVNNERITRFDLREIWTKPYWPRYENTNLYRPLTSTTFAIDWKIGGGHAGAFVAVNILLHAGAALAAYALLRRLFPNRKGMALASVLIFAVHPLHVEAVVGIVGRAEVMAALFTLLGYRIWLDAERDRSRARAVAAAGLWLAALLSKESAVALPMILLAHRLGILPPASPGKRWRSADLVWPAAFAVALILRAAALGGIAAPRASKIDNPLAFVDPLHRVLGACGVLARQGLQILTGRGLSADYSYAQVDPGPGLYIAGAVCLILIAAAAAWALTRGRRDAEGWGIAFFVCFWIVTSNVLMAIGTVQADRLLYLPLLGVVTAVAALAARAPERWRPGYVPPIVVGVCVLGSAAGSMLRTQDWKSDQTLFESALRVAPRSVKVRSNLSALLLRDQKPESARRVLEILAPVAEQARGFGPYLHWKGKAHLYLGDLAQARVHLLEALAVHADSAETLVELGNIAITQENGAEALACFDAVAGTGKLDEHARIGRASALALLSRYDEAADAWLPIVAALPDSIPVRAACAWNLTEAGRAGEAASLLREGLSKRSDPRLWTALARALLAGAGTPMEALDAAVRGDSSDVELLQRIERALAQAQPPESRK